MRYLILAALLTLQFTGTYAQDVPEQERADHRAADLETTSPAEPAMSPPVEDAALAVKNENGDLRLWLNGAGALIAPGALGGGAGAVPVSGDGIRLMWIAQRAAFRAGRAFSSNAWDPANVGNYSIAFGFGTTASGTTSTAVGFQATASGLRSTAMGSVTTASGDHSTAMGTSTEAGGSSSLAAGYRSGALHNGTFVWADRSSTGRFESTADAQFLVRAAGGVGIGVNNPNSALHVRANSDTPNPLRVQNSLGATRFRVTSNGGTSIGTDVIPPEQGLYVYGSVGIRNINPAERLDVNGNVRAWDYTTYSDARLKTAVLPLTGALSAVTALAGVRYEWDADLIAEDASLGGTQIGFLAQDVREVLPELVREGADGSLAVSYSQLVPVLVEALKEQQAEIEALRAENEVLRSNDDALEARLERMERLMEMVASRD